MPGASPRRGVSGPANLVIMELMARGLRAIFDLCGPRQRWGPRKLLGGEGWGIGKDLGS